LEYGIASLRGKPHLYRYSIDSKVMVGTGYDNYRTVNQDTFNCLFHELDDYRAALKEYCVEYVVYDPDEPLSSYPEWFIEAYDNGFIYEEEDYSEFIFYCAFGDIVMSDGSVVLRNYKGDMTYMEWYQFDEHYES